MNNMKKLYEFPDSWYVSGISVQRDAPGTKLSLLVKFTNNSKSMSINLTHPDNDDILTALLDADHVVISQESGSQREFGTVHVECFSETYFECWCDSANVA